MMLSRRAFLASTALFASTKRRPNIIFILTDDQGYGDLGCHGNPHLKTPNLDRLHRESTRFTHFHSSPLCSPTRASLMTGRYSYRTGIVDTWVGLAQMRPTEVTLAEVLRNAGYRTGLFGKWHLGDNYPMRATDQGFEETLVHTDGAIGGIADPAPNTYFDPVLFRNGRVAKTAGYCTDVFFREGMRFIEKHRNDPFFLYLPTNVPHGPLQVADSYTEPYRKLGLPDEAARIYGMIANLDENVGWLLGLLTQMSLEQNTIVLFMSDNGLIGLDRFNAGLRDQKESVYDGGIRVPFFMRWPGTLAAAVDVDRIAAHIDVFPTLLDLCGVPLPGGLKLDGISLRPLLQAKSPDWPDRTLFVQQSRPDPAGIDEPRLFTHCAARTQRFKIVMTAKTEELSYTQAIGEQETELYDMQADPGERTNIASQHPEIVKRMRADYEAWFKDVTQSLKDPVPIPLGDKLANPVLLTSQELRGPRAPEAPWNHNRAARYRKSEPDGYGYWEVDVKRAGRYEFTSRLGIPGDPGPLKAGKARLRIGAASQEQLVTAGDTVVRMTLRLKPGPARLGIAIEGQRKDSKLISPFFVDVRYLGR